MLVLVAVVITIVALLNIFQTDRPTVSVSENRNLATMPELTLDTILDSSYFSDLSAFFSDTFIQREKLVGVSKKMDLWKSLSVIYEWQGDFIVIADPNATAPPATEDTYETLPTLPPLTFPTTAPTVAPTTQPTFPPQTTVPVDPTAPTQPTEPTEPTQPTEPVIPLILSHTSLNVTAGAAQNITATVGKGYTDLTWHSSNPAVATVSTVSSNTAAITAVAAGEAAISATVTGPDGQKTSLVCAITVTEPVIDKPVNTGEADFLPNGMFIYNGAAYSQSYFGGKNLATSFANVYERYAQLFPNSRVSVILAPMATITITDSSVTSKISDEGAVLDKYAGYMPDSVNYVNLKEVLRAHADEYLYFKSDHHWTQRGAYYAYSEFIKSIGMEPTDISKFTVKNLNTKYIGSMYGFTGDERIKTFYDTIEAYLPTKSCKMTIYGTQWGTLKRNYCIATDYTNYLAFLMGDNGYTVINVPENDQSLSVLVIKDSFGNTFVPYLTEHYGNIYIIDPRHIDLNIYEEFKDANLTDIVFLINLQSAANKAWYNYFYGAIT